MSKYRSAAGVASGDREPTLPLRRVPASGKVCGIVTTRVLREIWTHYHRGRTVGCTRPHCPGCNSNAAQRYEGYIGLYSSASKFHCIFGLTVGAVRQISDQLGRLENLRGLCITLSRSSKKPNARIAVKCEHMLSDTSALPADFEVLEHLQRIWGVEAAEDAVRWQEGEPGHNPKQPTIEQLYRADLDSQLNEGHPIDTFAIDMEKVDELFRDTLGS